MQTADIIQHKAYFLLLPMSKKHLLLWLEGAYHNSPVFIDLFYERPGEGDRGMKQTRYTKNLKIDELFMKSIFKKFS